ncbi:head decoration protein [Rhodothalassium salexigens]|uniref:head decoration protein n=1 Tax=Rhodothalassium salexigens TaxID=1086 RepID=UPI0019149ED8|nr:head decoration protein [Rhodothalassium salexigens]
MTSTTPMTHETHGPLAFLVSEAAGARSRDAGLLGEGHRLEPGAILARVAASGAYAPVDPAADDGRETAAAVLCAAADSTAGPVEVGLIARDAEVYGARLGWPEGLSADQRAAIADDLAAAGLIVRT